MNPLNHSFLRSWSVNNQIQQSHPARKRQRYRNSRREANEEILNAKVDRENFFLLGPEGGRGESLVADLSHE